MALSLRRVYFKESFKDSFAFIDEIIDSFSLVIVERFESFSFLAFGFNILVNNIFYNLEKGTSTSKVPKNPII